jgi:hypothetical protein
MYLQLQAALYPVHQNLQVFNMQLCCMILHNMYRKTGHPLGELDVANVCACQRPSHQTLSNLWNLSLILICMNIYLFYTSFQLKFG